jgi:pimeloyl-ACP methyl ester carboxylesterase
MRSFWLNLFLLAAVPAAASAQVKPVDIPFESADGVDLQGTFYPSKNGGGSATVIIMHSPFKDPNKGDWAGLAKTLAEEGFNVLRFDFRGHGKSVELKDKKLFWENPNNARAMPSLASKSPKTIDFKNFQRVTAYYPMFANDLMAARIAMDLKNDASATNTSSVYLIGPEDTMSIGMAFLAAEWTRPNILQQGGAVTYVPWGKQFWAPAAEEAGKDVAACIWLSPARHASIPTATIKRWAVDHPKMREENPMLTIYGSLDTTSAATSKFLLNEVLVAKPTPPSKLEALKFTTSKEVPKSKNVGVDLLGNNLGTEKIIVDYLTTIEKDRKNRLPKQRYYSKPPIINLPSYGINQ